MEEIQFNKLYNIDDERLYSNFERFQNLYKELDPIETISKFLLSQSIGNDVSEVSEVLSYYLKRLFKDNLLLDFAFEWIRAQKIRLEYKKYFNLNSYKTYTIALDDVIFLFFLKYDEYLRPLFASMEEYEYSALYQIYFNPKQSNLIDLDSILKKSKARVPTIIFNGEKLNTPIHTLREGLSEMINVDYREVFPSKIKIIAKETQDLIESAKTEKNFEGTMVERLVKFYCFQTTKIDRKEFNLAINQFLSSYFQFDRFYNFHEFKDKLINSLAEFIYSGLTEKYENYSMKVLLIEINTVMNRFEKNMTRGRLKGKAWVEDLNTILLDFIEKFVGQL